MTLESTQVLARMVAMNISWEVKAVGRQPYQLLVLIVLKFGTLNLL